MTAVISVNEIGKAYRIYPSQRQRLVEWMFPFLGMRHNLHWTLQDISFQVQPGEALGLIGANGAGKSTLLKLIAGTVRPSAGNIKVRGKIAALLELGMGFHPDFTGRQNAFMAGQLLGYTSKEMTELMPEIEAFAEIGDYIDQPVRVYSSGMQMRLAFSVATAKRPEILIVDEALSVGDAYFQHKSFDRIREFRRQGSALLIVSHDRGAIQAICDKAILLSEGKILKQGAPEEIMDYYSALLAEKEHMTVRQVLREDGKYQTISGTGEASVSGVRLKDKQGNTKDTISVGSEVILEIDVAINQPINRLVLGFMIKDKLGQSIYGINTHRLKQPIEQLEAGETVTYRYHFNANMGPGNYSVAISLSRTDSHLEKNFEWRDYALVFHVINPKREQFVGCCWLNPSLEITRNQEPQLRAATSHS